MSQMIIYTEATDSIEFSEVKDDTFAIIKGEDGTFAPMTYNEWEALSCRQAAEGALAKLSESELAEDAKTEVAGMLNSFSETMQSKYLHGNRSWVQLFDELLNDFAKLAK